ncbi:hypothetical protein SDC9_190105 [bioreactor metagenome]|uniref:Uncharacterized protein n=1 Tax=bioreactor metagenome TaxID=1076179 RepID=A0A645HU39_9ZZZZ
MIHTILNEFKHHGSSLYEQRIPLIQVHFLKPKQVTIKGFSLLYILNVDCTVGQPFNIQRIIHDIFSCKR